MKEGTTAFFFGKEFVAVNVTVVGDILSGIVEVEWRAVETGDRSRITNQYRIDNKIAAKS